MIENRAVDTNGDIHRCKHASQGKKVKKRVFLGFFLFYLFILEKLIKISRVGSVTRVGRVTPIKHFFLGLTMISISAKYACQQSNIAIDCTITDVNYYYSPHSTRINWPYIIKYLHYQD